MSEEPLLQTLAQLPGKLRMEELEGWYPELGRRESQASVDEVGIERGQIVE